MPNMTRRPHRARGLRARAVLRARRAGFLTPEDRQRSSGTLQDLGPMRCNGTRARFTNLHGPEAVVLAGYIDVTLTVETRIRRGRRRRPGECGPGRLTGVRAEIAVSVSPEDDPACMEHVIDVLRMHAVRVEVWKELPGSSAVMLLTLLRLDVTWRGPGEMLLRDGWASFQLLRGTAAYRAGGPVYQLAVIPAESPVLVA